MPQDNAGYYKKALLLVWLLGCVLAILILGMLHASIQIAVSSEGPKPTYPTAVLLYIRDVLPSVSATIVAFLVVYTLYYYRIAPSQLAVPVGHDDILLRQCGIWVEVFRQSTSPDFSIGCFYRDESGRFHYDGTRFGPNGDPQHHWHSKALACIDNECILYIYKRPSEKSAATEDVPYTDGMGVIYIRPTPDNGEYEFKVARFSDRSRTVVDVDMRRYKNVASQGGLKDTEIDLLLSRNGVDDLGRTQLGKKIAGQISRT